MQLDVLRSKKGWLKYLLLAFLSVTLVLPLSLLDKDKQEIYCAALYPSSTFVLQVFLLYVRMLWNLLWSFISCVFSKPRTVLWAACDVPGIKRLLPTQWRELDFFNNIYELVVPVVTIQLRYNGWVYNGCQMLTFGSHVIRIWSIHDTESWSLKVWL